MVSATTSERTDDESDRCFHLEMAYKKMFCVTDFGMCHLEDLVNEVKDNKELVVEVEKDLIKLYRKGTSRYVMIESKWIDRPIV